MGKIAYVSVKLMQRTLYNTWTTTIYVATSLKRLLETTINVSILLSATSYF